MNYRAEDIVEMIENEWKIGGEVICEYSDDDFDVEEEEEIEYKR